jgi:membrane-bound serine protease (ClpP class)
MGRVLRATALAFFVLALCTAQSAVGTAVSSDRPAAPPVVELHLDGEVEPIMAEYINAGIDQANREGAALILITMNTPGGLDTSMRSIIEHMLDSSVPVVVYVTPSGARAASAGFFILLAADVAAMAPGTHTGAASPIAAIGGYPVTLDETMKNKILNDATAYLRSYASRRGRNVELAETAITDAKAFTEREAIEGKLVDLVEPSREVLLSALDGRTIHRFDGRSTTIALHNPPVVPVDMSSRQRFLARIVEPDAFFVLLLVAALGLYTEFTHPGMVLPGVVGGIAALLALYAMHILPVNATGLLLLGLALVLFLLEAKYTSHGVLGGGGIIAMFLGALMLVSSPITPGGVSVGVALGATIPFALLTILLMRLVIRSRGWAPQTGVDELKREVGVTRSAIGGLGPATDRFGLVFVHGELWRADSRVAIPIGTRVRVVGVDGLTLHVEPVE